MKKLVILFALCSVAFTSCELDKFPADKQVMDLALETLSDMEKFENGVYAAFRTANNVVLEPSDIQSDYFNAVAGWTNVSGDLHKWTFQNNDYSVYDVWAYAYVTIANANFVLSKKDAITYDTENPAEVAKFNTILGEMYFVRAMSHFILVDKFCGAYDSAKATEAYSGIPVMLTFDSQAMPGRETLEKSYEAIINDLKSAETLLADVAGEKNAMDINADVVNAALARVYLQKKDYANAYKYATDVINTNTYALLDSAEDLKAQFTDDAGDEVIFVFYASKTELSGIDGSRFVYDENSKNDNFKPDLIPTKTVLDMYADNDIRKDAYFFQTSAGICEINGQKLSTPIYLFNKYPGNPALQKTAGSKNYANAVKLFRLPEMYLIAAEAGISDTDATTDGAKYLNDLRQKRGLAAIATPAMADVKEERVREMIFEGQRIGDLKRWGDTLLARTPQTAKNDKDEDFAIHTDGVNFNNLTVAKDDFRWVWAIPAVEIFANQTLAAQQNPGWPK
jgi:hypothetical protein